MRNLGIIIGLVVMLFSSCGKTELDSTPPTLQLVSPIENKAYSASLGVPLVVNVSDNLNLTYFVLVLYNLNSGSTYMRDSIPLTGKTYQYNKSFQSKFITSDSSRMVVSVTVSDNTNNRVSSQIPIWMTK